MISASVLSVPAGKAKMLSGLIGAIQDNYRSKSKEIIIELTLEKELMLYDVTSRKLWVGERVLRSLFS